MNIQLIDRKLFVFRVGNNDYQFVKPNLLFKNFGTIIKATVKGSTLGWNIEGGWMSYCQIKRLFNEKKKQVITEPGNKRSGLYCPL